MGKSFIDLANMAKRVMHENQQPSVQQELEKLLPSTRGGRGGRELPRFGAGESSASAETDTNTSFQYHLLQNEQLQIYKDQKLVETTCKFAIFFHVKPSDFRFVTWSCQFSSLVFPDDRLKFSEQKQKLSYFEPFQSHPKEICRVMTLNLCYRDKCVKETMF